MSKYTKILQENILNGKLEEADRVLYGTYREYHVLVSLRGEIRVKISVCTKEEEVKKDLKNYVKEQIRKSGIIDNESYYDDAYYEINLGVRTSGTAEIDAQRTDTTIKNLVAFLSDHGFEDCCALCGKQTIDRAVAEIDGAVSYLCMDCAKKFTKDAKKTSNRAEVFDEFDNHDGAAESKPKKEAAHVILGTFGAIAGLFIGTACWVGLRDEYYAFTALIITVLMMVTFYAKLSKGLDLAGIIICSVLAFVGSVAGPYMGWSYAAYEGLKEYGYTFWECCRYLLDIVAEADLVGKFIIDVLLSFGVAVIATIVFVKSAQKDGLGKKKFRILKKENDKEI